MVEAEDEVVAELVEVVLSVEAISEILLQKMVDLLVAVVRVLAFLWPSL